MRILVVTKPTNFELHGGRVEANIRKGISTAKSMLERLKVAHSQHHQALELVCGLLEARGIDYELHRREQTWPDTFRFDLILTVGGDGTLLYASHHVPAGGRIVGLRSSDASVGFTCLAGNDQIEAALEDVLEDRVQFVTCSRAEVEVRRVDGSGPVYSVPVLNDILYANCSPAATTRYRLAMDSTYEIHKSSGIWISTSVGSTAAILAAGGVEQTLTDRRFQYKVRELYRPLGRHYSLTGATFDPDSESLCIENRCEAAIVALDGQHGEIALQFGDQVLVKRGPDIQLANPQYKSHVRR